MDKVMVDKNQLLEKLRANRANHRKVFEAAVEVYRTRAVEELERMLDDAKNGRKIARQIGLVTPVDYTKEYDRAITMLEMSRDTNITIDSRDFARFVMDDWEWRESFSTSTASYLVTEG